MAAALAASDIYPAVRRFLLETGLARTLKGFEKETAAGDDAEAVGPGKKVAKAIRKIELTAACQLVVGDSAVALAASDIYPAVARFLLENGLARTLKAFEKETAAGDDAEAVGPGKKVAKAIRKMELTAACQLMLEERAKKRKLGGEEAVAATEAEEPPKKRKREAEAEAQPEPVAEVPKELSKKEKKQKEQQEKSSGIPFSRVDHSKWMATIKDDRLIDNTHLAKQKFGGSGGGDSWGDSAAADMLKVKGKGFRKEMAKKKRSSWRGGGEIDQGCNSIRLADSSDDE